MCISNPEPSECLHKAGAVLVVGAVVLVVLVFIKGQCKTQIVDCRLQTRGRMQAADHVPVVQRLDNTITQDKSHNKPCYPLDGGLSGG